MPNLKLKGFYFIVIINQSLFIQILQTTCTASKVPGNHNLQGVARIVYIIEPISSETPNACSLCAPGGRDKTR